MGATVYKRAKSSIEDDKCDDIVIDSNVVARQAASGVRRRRTAKPVQWSSGAARLAGISEVPEYLADNEFILSFYRRPTSVLQSVWSAFNIHNETVNIWTHGLGFLLFLILAIYVVRHPPTPLALSADSLEHVWDNVQHRFLDLKGKLGERLDTGLHRVTDSLHSLQLGLSENLHALEDRLSDMQQGLSHNLHALEDRLSDNLHALEGRMQLGVAALEEGMASGVAALEGRMQQGVAALKGELSHHLPDVLKQLPGSIQAGSAHLGGALEAHVQRQLRPVLQWPSPRWPVYVYLAGAMACLATSTMAHVLGCCQKHISDMVWRFDYTGITVLIVASFVPPIYYAFLCEPFWRIFYLVTTCMLGFTTFVISLMEKFQAAKYRVFRATVYVLLGCWGIVPICHQLWSHANVWAIQQAFKLDLLMGFFYLLGAFLFASRIPECWMPGKFDLLGASHQLFHACVVVAAYIHYRAIMLLLEWRDASGGCALCLERSVPVMLAEMKQQGAELLHIDQVWHNLSLQLHEYMVSSAPVLEA